MQTQEIINAIKFLQPNAEFSFTNDNYSTIKWDILKGDAPTWEEIESAHLEIKAAEDAAKAQASAKRQALLERLGITEDEAKLLAQSL